MTVQVYNGKTGTEENELDVPNFSPTVERHGRSFKETQIGTGWSEPGNGAWIVRYTVRAG